MARTHFDQDWKDWVSLNVERGCSKDELFRILIDEGFDYDAVRRELNHQPSVEISVEDKDKAFCTSRTCDL